MTSLPVFESHEYGNVILTNIILYYFLILWSNMSNQNSKIKIKTPERAKNNFYVQELS